MNTAGRVLAVVDDVALAARVIESACMLAQLMRREFELVFVEDVAALHAATLPLAQVLSQGRIGWAPLAPADIERAWQVHAERLRVLALRATAARAVPWSMRITRGRLHETAIALLAQPRADLLLAAPPGLHLPGETGERRRIDVFDDGSPQAREALGVARRLAESMDARLAVHRIEPGAAEPPWPADTDLVVLPDTPSARTRLARLRQPVLVVGTPA